jgi:putative Mn2+ efflux pump MntP
MKTVALWLYALAFLFSFVVSGPTGIAYLFPFLAFLVTALWFVVSVVVVPVVRWASGANRSQLEPRRP